MSNELIEKRQRSILQILVNEGKLSSAQSLAMPVSENIESVIPDINRLANDENSVAAAVGKSLNRKVFTEVDDGRHAILPPNMDSWIIYDNTIYMTNPLDSRASEQAMAFVRRKSLDMKGLAVGVISPTKLDALRAGTVEDDETVVVDKEAQKQMALKRIDDLVAEASKRDASDIHLQPTQGDKVLVRFRLDGDLRSQRSYSMNLHDSVCRVILDNKCGLSLESGIPQDGKFDFDVSNNKKINLRVSSLPITRGSDTSLKLVLRLLGNNTKLSSLSRLGFSRKNLEILQRLGEQPNGMIIVTGPTGSGKTTLLMAMLLDIFRNNPNQNYQTIEDPVEIQVEGITQTEVKGNLTFPIVLRAVLRQDPDVILLGEARDEETVELAFRGAMTGHLLLTTLHTNNAHLSLGRLEDMNVTKDIIASNVMAIVGQRLVKQLCIECRKEYIFSADKARFNVYSSNAAFDCANPQELKLYKANPLGCKVCGTDSGGLKGRHAILEILEVKPEIQQAILDGQNPSIMRRNGIADGSFNDLWDDGLRLVREGVVDFEQLEKVLRPYMNDRITGKQVTPIHHQESFAGKTPNNSKITAML
jgi:general secretion pathway protein E